MKDKIQRIDSALDRLAGQETHCLLCPRECGVNRRQGEKGTCQSGGRAAVSRALLHYGEEPVLSGYEDWKTSAPSSKRKGGSGTIFFTGCNLKCLFCQNYQLSWFNEGSPVEDVELAKMMLRLQDQGALNINFVSPSHLILPILRALRIASEEGLALPLVWNSNGYEKAEILKSLEGIIDIWLPDLKYFSPETSQAFSQAPDYLTYASAAVREMFRQQPGLSLNESGIARRGILIRHLVLPGQVEDSLKILEWIAVSLSPDVHLSLMSQYHPCFNAPPELQRPLSAEEYSRVLTKAEELEFENALIQPEVFDPDAHLVPDFTRPDPFGWE